MTNQEYFESLIDDCKVYNHCLLEKQQALLKYILEENVADEKSFTQMILEGKVPEEQVDRHHDIACLHRDKLLAYNKLCDFLEIIEKLNLEVNTDRISELGNLVQFMEQRAENNYYFTIADHENNEIIVKNKSLEEMSKKMFMKGLKLNLDRFFDDGNDETAD